VQDGYRPGQHLEHLSTCLPDRLHAPVDPDSAEVKAQQVSGMQAFASQRV
jgi:hypothetical protein